MKDQYDKIMDKNISETEKSLSLFLFIEKRLLFGNGNKRTALITANSAMFNQGVGLISIPEENFSKFNELLSVFYNSNSHMHYEKIKDYMYSNCIFGIEFFVK